jgi:hypothetical protein
MMVTVIVAEFIVSKQKMWRQLAHLQGKKDPIAVISIERVQQWADG